MTIAISLEITGTVEFPVTSPDGTVTVCNPEFNQIFETLLPLEPDNLNAINELGRPFIANYVQRALTTFQQMHALDQELPEVLMEALTAELSVWDQDPFEQDLVLQSGYDNIYISLIVQANYDTSELTKDEPEIVLTPINHTPKGVH